MRPCVACGHRSDPAVSPVCPECGERQLPNDWVVVLRECPTWFWVLGHLGSLLYLGILAGWVVSMATGGHGPSPGAFIYLGIACFPTSAAHLKGKRLDDIWIVTGTKLEHRPRVGNTTYHDASGGWELKLVAPPEKAGRPWKFHLARVVGGKTKGAALMQVDGGEDDPAAVEAAVRRALTPASASGT